MKLSSIYIYPVKSLGGIKLLSSEIDTRGLKYDRRWMIVDSNNRFVTQRTHPRLALIDVFREGENFILEDRGGSGELGILPLSIESPENSKVIIWDDVSTAYFSDEKSSRWISEILNGSYRFVYMPETEERKVENNQEHIVSFADAYPFLIIGESSLDDLNNRLEEKMEMIRFRPNFVFTGGRPYEEDEWELFKIGNETFSAVKPCSRCAIPTINPHTSERSDEPTKTLAQYRNWNHKVYFGMNLICFSRSGKIHTGDPIDIIQRYKTTWEEIYSE